MNKLSYFVVSSLIVVDKLFIWCVVKSEILLFRLREIIKWNNNQPIKIFNHDSFFFNQFFYNIIIQLLDILFFRSHDWCVLLDLGWKHIKREVPREPPVWNDGSSDSGGSGTPSKIAGKSFSWIHKSIRIQKIRIFKTNIIQKTVCFTFPFGLATPGHSGLEGSKSGKSTFSVASSWPLHGRFIRCGLTKIHCPFNGL